MNASAHYNLGYLLHRRDGDGALEYYRKAAALEPRNPPVHYNLGRITRGDVAQARALYRRVIVLAPERRAEADARERLVALGVDMPTEPVANGP